MILPAEVAERGELMTDDEIRKACTDEGLSAEYAETVLAVVRGEAEAGGLPLR